MRDDDVDERPIITSGDELALLGAFFAAKPGYTASDVIDHLLSLSIASNGQLNGSNGHAAATNGHVALNGHHANGNGVASNGNGVASNGNGSSNGNGVGHPAQVHSKVIA